MVIALIILDIDGTLTSGGITYGLDVELKTFDVKDGLILVTMQQMGIPVVFLTGRKSEAITRRAADINATAIQGVSDKKTALRNLIAERGVLAEETAYIGDDLNDYAAMKMCRFKACPSDSALEIKAISDYISPYPGGHGAVRDICEQLLHELGRYGEYLEIFGVE